MLDCKTHLAHSATMQKEAKLKEEHFTPYYHAQPVVRFLNDAIPVGRGLVFTTAPTVWTTELTSGGAASKETWLKERWQNKEKEDTAEDNYGDF